MIEEKQFSNGVTVVTGIWNINRDSLTEGWSRSFEHYLNNLEKLLKTPSNLIIFIQKEYEDFIRERRPEANTQIIIRELDWFKSNNLIYDKIQEIRTNPAWYGQSGWLPESTQARLEWYNPIVMSKIFLLNDARIFDKFNSSHLVWVDGGLTNTVHEGYFWHDKVLEKLDKYFDKFSFVAFPYDGKVEIHGFEYGRLCDYAEGSVDKVCRGGIFGGPKQAIEQANNIYYGLLSESLTEGLMGTEESIFTAMTYKHPELFQYYEIESNGLLGTFFENLKNNTLQAKAEFREGKPDPSQISLDVALYVLTYNSPKQLETLCKSFTEYDEAFLTQTTKYLLNNSTNRETDAEYAQLCEIYGFTEIKKDNIGICGGRQFIAEHFAETPHTHYMFYEDDMFFYHGSDTTCRNGFIRKVPNLLNKVVEIIKKENYDFIKFNFSEFFGDNSTQWAWYNVPQQLRQEIWPNNCRLPEYGQSKNAPRTVFKHIKSYAGLPYADGEIYYSNWPQIVSKSGNKKMFLDVTWTYPYEQTWMSHMFQETIKGNLNPALLLATPTEHNRFEHYDSSERREH